MRLEAIESPQDPQERAHIVEIGGIVFENRNSFVPIGGEYIFRTVSHYCLAGDQSIE